LLPHGFEGQGPEHSSARIERFLQLSSNNWKVINLVTPSNYFHALREQALRGQKKDSMPLILFTPKSTLRTAVSDSNDSTTDHFNSIICKQKDPNQVEFVIFCSGKIYFELFDLFDSNKKVLLILIEQLYPFPETEINHELSKIKNKKVVYIYIQEEPKNQGTYIYVNNCLQNLERGQVKNGGNSIRLQYIGRENASAVASGFFARHKKEHKEIINKIKKTVFSSI
jgi:2-oxoglutarate dehydrogenase E1 component